MLRDIDRLDMREVIVEEKMKKIEVKLRKNIEIKEQSQAKTDISDVIRRRKGEPEKRISCKLNKQLYFTQPE